MLVANEVGLGIVPDNPLARAFRDDAGRLNQDIAAIADRVVFIAAGLPLILKEKNMKLRPRFPRRSSPASSAPARPAWCATWSATRADAGWRSSINEFGELGIDRELLLGCGDETCAPDDIVELANGCICCTVADDFLPTIEPLIDRARPARAIVIETSGLALPKPLVQAFAWPEMRTRMTVDGVIAVIDAAAAAEGRLRRPARGRSAADPIDHDNPLEEVFTDQLACADLVVAQQDRPGRRRSRSPRCARDRGARCGRASKLVEARRQDRRRR